MKNVNGIIKEIANYESNFNGGLIHGYKGNIEEFKNDLMKEIDKNGVSEILEFYRTYLNSSNDISEAKIKKLNDLILILEGFFY